MAANVGALRTNAPIGPTSPGPQPGDYTVQDGDTLQSIARALWGDASLWYLIADANGLTSADTLVGGQSLTIPSKVTNLHNTSDTFRVYDPNTSLGSITPGLGYQPKPPSEHGCGVLGAIIVAVIAIVVFHFAAGFLGSGWAATLGVRQSARRRGSARRYGR